MKKCKILYGLVLLLVTSCLLAGCGVKERVTVNPAAKTVETVDKFYLTEAELKAASTSGKYGDKVDISKFEKTQENGKTYYVTSQKKVLKGEELTKKNIVLDSHKFIQYTNGSMVQGSINLNGSKPDFQESTYLFPKKIVSSSRKILADGKSVDGNVDKIEGYCFYVAFDDTAAKAKRVSFTGVKNKGCYNKEKTVQMKTEGIITDILVNGKSAPGLCYSVGNNGIWNIRRDYVTLSKEGKYTVTAVLSSGARKSVTVTIDKKKPSTNIKNNKSYKRNVRVKFTDQTSGIKKALLNGKKIKSGVKIRKRGAYKLVLKDKAGNTRTVRFRVK